MYIGFLGIFQVVFSLYNIRNDAVNYAMLLSLLWLVVYAVTGFLRFRRQHQLLEQADQTLSAGTCVLPDDPSSSLSQAPRTVRADASPDADNHFLSFPLHPEAHRCPLTASGLPAQEADAVSGT